tara:strand:- start:1295 stop:1612 length:318 start_codon:yes stop_codon:yes gene_type:complete
MPSVFDRGYPMIDATGSATNQSVTIGTSSAQSAAFAATTKVVRLSSNNNCFLAFGSNPTATSSSIHMHAHSPLFAKVNPGEKVAVISHNTVATGKLSIHEMKSDF